MLLPVIWTDPNTVNKFHGRYKKRDTGNGRGSQPEFSNRRSFPQKTRSALDKRPRQRSYIGYRQRETVSFVLCCGGSACMQPSQPIWASWSHIWYFPLGIALLVSISPVGLMGRGRPGKLAALLISYILCKQGTPKFSYPFGQSVVNRVKTFFLTNLWGLSCAS